MSNLKLKNSSGGSVSLNSEGVDDKEVEFGFPKGSGTVLVENDQGEVVLSNNEKLATEEYVNSNGGGSGVNIDTDPELTSNSDIKVPSQKAVKSYVDTSIDNSKTFINVKDFGAVGDGITNDTTAVRAAHNFANSKDLQVSYSGLSEILVDSNSQIEIKTSVDFNNCLFKLNESSVPGTRSELFLVIGEERVLNPANVALDLSLLSKGSHEALDENSNKLPDGWYSIQTDIELTPRTSAPNTNIYYDQFFYVRNGTFDYPVCKDWTNASVRNISYRPDNHPLVISNFLFDASTLSHQMLFAIQRNRVTIENIRNIGHLDSTGLHMLISIQRCGDFYGKNISITAAKEPIGAPTGGGSYVLHFTKASSVYLDKIVLSSGDNTWGATAGSASNVHISNSEVNRIDTHSGIYGLFVSNCIFLPNRNGGAGVRYGWGGGEIILDNIVSYGNSPLVDVRSDYQGDFDGIIRISNITKSVSPQDYNNISSIDGVYYVHIFRAINIGGQNYSSNLADSLTIENIIIRSHGSYTARYVPIYITVKTGCNVHIPQRIDIRNIKIIGKYSNINNFIPFKDFISPNTGETYIRDTCTVTLDEIVSYSPGSISNVIGTLTSNSLNIGNVSYDIKIYAEKCELLTFDLDCEIATLSINNSIISGISEEDKDNFNEVIVKNSIFEKLRSYKSGAAIGFIPENTVILNCIVRKTDTGNAIYLKKAEAILGLLIEDGISVTYPDNVNIGNLVEGWINPSTSKYIK